MNYWETNPATGHPDGTTHIESAQIIRADDTGADIHLSLVYFPAGKPKAVVMRDTVELRISLPRADGSYCIDWQQTSIAQEKVELNRTPLVGEPEGKSWGGYGGLSLRGSRFLKDVNFLISEGIIGLGGHGKHARWMSLSGVVDQKPVAISMFEAPTNPHYPNSWFLVLDQKPTGPFWYFNSAFLYQQPYFLAPNEHLTRSYRIRIDAGVTPPSALDEEASQFNKTTQH